MKPKNIIIVRHGQSEGNANPEIRKLKPDYALNLTPLGEAQAKLAGEKLKDEFGEEKFSKFVEEFGDKYDLKDPSILENSKWNEILEHFRNI